MAIAQITAWLNDKHKHYPAGVALFEQYGTNSLQKVFFRNGNSPYHLSRLTESLGKINVDAVQPSITTPAVQVAIIPQLNSIKVSQVRYSLSDDEWNRLPDAVKDLYTENSQLKSRAELAFHQARIAGSDESRLALGIQILDDRDQINFNWKKIRDYQASGKVTEKIVAEKKRTVDELTMAEMLAKLKNLPTYISKAKKNLETMEEGSKRNGVVQRIEEYQVTLDLIKKRLGDAV
jgi:hypothetical protein